MDAVLYAGLFSVLVIFVAVALFAIAASTLYLNTYAWWDPHTQQRTLYGGLRAQEAHSFSLIMPCRQEDEAVMRATLAALLGQSHTDLEVVISVGHDDPDTVAIAHRLAAEEPARVRVSVDTTYLLEPSAGGTFRPRPRRWPTV